VRLFRVSRTGGTPGIHLRVLRDLRFHFPCLLPAPARCAVPDRKENGTANHAEHAKGGGALQGQDGAFDLLVQAEMQACGRQIIQALRAMNLVDRLG
jgi:hypothetical protein